MRSGVATTGWNVHDGDLPAPKRPSGQRDELSIDLPWWPVSVTLFDSVPGGRPHYPHLESFALAD